MTLEEIDRRRSYYSVFDMMEDYRAEHPDATDDEIWDVVCFRIIPDRYSRAYDQMKDARHDNHA